MFRSLLSIVISVGCSAGVALAQPAAPAQPAPAPKPATTAAQPAAGAQPAASTTPASPQPSKLSIADLEKMLGAIALYPDNLLANVLTGSVYPAEVKKAHAYLAGGGDAEKIAAQGVEPPIQALAKVPDVLKMMNDNIEWTEALGQVYLLQSEDMMKAVQNLRAKAKQNGALKSGEQLTVVEQGSTIIIESPSPEVIYVPSYNPQVVYVDHHDSSDAVAAGIIGFGVGVAVGAIWHNNYCDWHGGCVGYGGGYADVDINVDRGDINIDNSKINNINKNEVRNNTSQNRAGKEGQKWKPNPTKASASNLSKPGGTASMDKFRGASSGSLPAGTTLPNPKRDTPAATSRQGAGASRAPSAGNTAVKPSAASRPSAGAQPAARPTPSAPAARPAPAAPKAQPNRSSGFSSSPAAASQSSRGSASRGSSGGGGGGSRGGGGGGGGRR